MTVAFIVLGAFVVRRLRINPGRYGLRDKLSNGSELFSRPGLRQSFGVRMLRAMLNDPFNERDDRSAL